MSRAGKLANWATRHPTTVLLLVLIGMALLAWVRSSGAKGDRVPWLRSWPEATRQAEKQDKGLLVYLTASWCVYCRDMERDVFSDEQFAAWLGERVVPLKVDVDAEPRLARRLDAPPVPKFMLYDAKGNLLGTATGAAGMDVLKRWVTTTLGATRPAATTTTRRVEEKN